LETTFHHLVAFKAAAEQGHERLAKGDNFIAEGYVREYNYRARRPGVEGEEFVARRIGHDLARTRYEVDRSAPSQRTERDAAPRRSPVPNRAGRAARGREHVTRAER
jgi:single-strand DNA-binding protein